MRKTRLPLDSLAVESFSPADAVVRSAGTVRAHDADPIPTLNTGYHGCYGCPVTLLSCAGTCP
jgi:hypothetical protein